MNFRPTSDWIISKSGLSYLELNLPVPCNQIFQEWLAVSDQAVTHRAEESISQKFFYGHVGWKSLVLYGKHSTATSDSQKPFDWTDIGKLCPFTQSWLMDNFVIDETTGRIRFMLLESGGHILPHIDRPNKSLSEINVAITNPPGCDFRFLNYGNVPFASGRAIMLDVSNEHLVYNGSDRSRLHIIIHGKLKNKKIIEESYASRYYN